MIKVCIQQGHINIPNNSIAQLRGGTGAPGEQELTSRIAPALADILKSKGIDVTVTDANANDDAKITSTDYQLFIALHGDADVYGKGGGLIGAPDPSLDSVNTESKRIRDVMSSVYFAESGIIQHNERLSVDMTKYYMWQFLSPKTPCVLLELGVAQDAHDKVILGDTQRTAKAVARAICKALNVQYDTPVPTPIPPQPSNDLLVKFINQFKGRTDVGNTDANKGQCVGLVSVWMDWLGIPHEWGDAKDLLNNADKRYFDVIYNDPNNYTQYPRTGSILVYDASWDGGFGHTGVITTANGTNYSLFEANNVTPQDPNGSCQVLFHPDYRGVIGWLQPKNIPQPINYDKFINEIKKILQVGTSQNQWNNIKNYVKLN